MSSAWSKAHGGAISSKLSNKLILLNIEERKTREMIFVARVMLKPPLLGDTADNPILC